VVVVGGGADKSAAVFGDTPNIAARVQTIAQPGTVMVTAAVHRLVSGLFVVEDCGTPALKGVERPIQLYRVVQPSGVRGRLGAAAAAHGLTPFVGREDEVRLLMNRWECALDGEGQVALIVGEAGIGKSRLMQQFQELIADTTHTWVEAGAGAFHQNTPFYPVTEMLREFLASRGKPRTPVLTPETFSPSPRNPVTRCLVSIQFRFEVQIALRLTSAHQFDNPRSCLDQRLRR
jgi:hypothetical protein